MSKVFRYLIIIMMILLLFVNFSKAEKVFAHYMAWYESFDDETKTFWGGSWKANNHKPDTIDQITGQRDISAVHYPLIGVYDSDDFKTLEYHVLLAQSSGLNGFIVNWFGTNSYYNVHVLGFEKLGNTVVPYLNQLNNNSVYSDFKLCISFDEQALDKYSSGFQSKASNHIKYIEDNYAGNPYYHIDDNTGKPLLLIWQYMDYLNKTQWDDLLEHFTNYFAIDFKEYPEDPNYYSHFCWPTGFSADGSSWGEFYLDSFYNASGTNSFLRFTTGGVWPGFDDSGRTNANIRLMKRYGLTTYRHTWDKIDNYTGTTPLNLVQIITWNDWTEGTEIEPSVEYAYDFIKETKTQISNFAPAPAGSDMSLLVPQYIYNARLACKQALPSVNAVYITNAIADFYNGLYYSALTNAAKAMGTEIPVMISAERGNSKIMLKWNKISSAIGYQVYVCKTSNYLDMVSGVTSHLVNGINSTNLCIFNLDNKQDYYCSVSAYVGNKKHEDRYHILGWMCPLVGLKGDAIAPAPVKDFKAEKVDNKIKLSWKTPDDNDFYSTYITYVNSGSFPQTPYEGTTVVQLTNKKNKYTEYYFSVSHNGYHYFSAFAMDKVENYSRGLHDSVYIVDKMVKLANNFIGPETDYQSRIYIDIPQSGLIVKITIYNLKGKIIKSFGEKRLQTGRNEFRWPESESELENIPSGVYLLSITGDIQQTEKIVVVK